MSATLSSAMNVPSAKAGTNATDGLPTDHDIKELSPYGYIPTKWICYLYLGLFTVSLFVHFVQATRYRMWFLYYTAVFAMALEALGWGSRLWSSYDIMNDLPFKLQICATIIAPTPLLAVNFVVLGRLVPKLGEAYSRLSAKAYTIFFFFADFIALIVQSAGGALAATQDDSTLGGNIMLGGIAYQLAVLTVFVLVAAEFIFRQQHNRPVRSKNHSEEETFLKNSRRTPLSKNLKMLVIAFAVNTLFLYIRAIYRLIELSDGWDGTVIRTEKWFNIFDAAMITLATYVINVAHPGRLLDTDSHLGAYALVTQPSSSTIAMMGEPKDV